MPFIQTGNDCRSKNCNPGPAQRPLRVIDSPQSLTPGSEKQNTQNRIAGNVPAFANVKVPNLEARPIKPEKKMQ